MESKTVFILNTGGTLSMKRKKDGLKNEEGYFHESLMNRYGSEDKLLKHSNTEIVYEELDEMIDSSLSTFEIIFRILKYIERVFMLYDRFVILHGTDTLTYSACFFHYSIQNPSKPIIFTGKMKPLIECENGWDDFDKCLLFDQKGTFISINGNFYLPMYLNKLHTSDLNSFVYNYERVTTSNYITDEETVFNRKFTKKIGIIKITPIVSYKTMKFIFSKSKAVVLIGYGSATIFYNEKILKLLKNSKIPIVITTECLLGSTSKEYEVMNKLKLDVFLGGQHSLASITTALSFYMANDLDLAGLFSRCSESTKS